MMTQMRPRGQKPARKARVFVSCAPEDATFLAELEKQLAMLRIRGHLYAWNSGTLEPHMDEADLILILISPDFLASKWSYLEVTRALLRHELDQARVIPILVRPTDWESTPLGVLTPLPKEGKPISNWKDREDAWVDVAGEIRRILETLAGGAPASADAPELRRRSAAPEVIELLKDIFRTFGQPSINFVEPAQLWEIKERLRKLGEGLVVQGASGVGKTTAVKKALDDLLPEIPITWLLAQKKSDLVKLDDILASAFPGGGHLIVDDFHRLDTDRQRGLADLIKILSDENRQDAKVTVIGINPAGVSLVKDFPDLAGRFAIISMGKQPDEKIEELIAKGEAAANVVFRHRSAFVRAAAGNFFTAQLLCYEAALKEEVTQTSPTTKIIEIGPGGYVMDKVQHQLALKYHEPLLLFASHDEKPPPRGACLSLLWLLSQSDDAAVSLQAARARYPQLSPALNWLSASNLGRLFQQHFKLSRLFHYNRDAAILSTEDPQLEFYLRNLKWQAFVRDTGHDGVRFDPENGLVFSAIEGSALEVIAIATQATPPGSLPPSVILHLSDLHFGSKPQAQIWSNQLAADLKLELKVKRLDAVVLSGDISNRAAPEEYQAASLFLRLIQQEFNLAPQQVVMVPGNHDASWVESTAAYTPMRRADYKAALEEGHFIDSGSYIEVRDDEKCKRRFAAFAEFYRENRLEPYPLEYEKQATLHYLQAQRLVVLGLNSAWSLDHHFKNRPGIHGVALGEALRLIRTTPVYDDCLKLAVWHHPLASSGEDRIKDTGFLELLAQAGFRLGLHGHIHKAAVELFRYDIPAGGRRVDLLSAGTFGAPTREWVPGYPLQYQLFKLQGRRLTAYTRRREDPDGSWQPDARWKQGAGKSPLPYYEVDL